MNDESLPSAAARPQVPVFCQVGSAEDTVGYRMRRIVNLLAGEIERRMEPLGLTDAQWKPLLRMFASGDTTVATLARGCHLDAGAMTRLLDRLEAKNLCRRIRSVEDRRVVNLELTDEGRVAARQIPDVVAEVQAVAAAGFSQQEFDQLKEYLERILTNVLPFGGDADASAQRSSASVSASEGSKK
ncbi:MarR family transcriptional regulator [Xylophilus rhododendri]|uniref:MarR family transcriptional regulator n=1 Tax=Xylophilus rhododendri TaxID=2697032 RepID=A0A857JCT9_9BURK|nr:MarR family transcriptional regulator [Xylophilus rhododendri]QHJ00783.1 MarR family transcriptional regulator [Xylophilus rhododendri]